MGKMERCEQVGGHVGMRMLTPTARKGGGSLAIKKRWGEVAVVDQKEGGQGGGPPTRTIYSPTGRQSKRRKSVRVGLFPAFPDAFGAASMAST